LSLLLLLMIMVGGGGVVVSFWVGKLLHLFRIYRASLDLLEYSYLLNSLTRPVG
jgi:hypothetical protein